MTNGKQIIIGSVIIAAAIVFGPIVREAIVSPAKAAEADSTISVYLPRIWEALREIKACRD